MININSIISNELSVKLWQVENTLKLKADGSTIPFIARYRKEATGELDEMQIRDIFDRFEYLTELEDRKLTILKSIEEQGKLTDELKAKIEECLKKNELEDLYLPYKPKKRTRATIAKEKGLEPLANYIKEHNQLNYEDIDLETEGKKYISEELGVLTFEDAAQGASDIIAEEISERAELRAWIRNYFQKEGIFVSKIKDEFEVGTTKYEMYRSFESPVTDIKPHNMLALRRGESEKIIMIDLKFDEDYVLQYLERFTLLVDKFNIVEFYRNTIKDAFNRLMKTSLITDVRLTMKKIADEESIKVFEKNLRNLLLTSPAGMKPILGVDPGFRTGCKVVVLDRTGKFIEYTNINILNENGISNAKKTLESLIKKYNIELIAIGNGTASRETDEVIASVIESLNEKPVKVIVNESGASIYSASPVAQEEFPDLDLTVRGSISIGRRLQDPLAELVKIDPKSIGVGQYQHDVDQKLLKKNLEETVESCVNYVGVDLNTASKELLTYVSGISPNIAKNIIEWRNTNGAFSNRKQLMKVKMFGTKAFEQSAGFLRIRNGENILDNTAVHPESYHIVEKIIKDMELSKDKISDIPLKLSENDLKKYVSENIGMPTLIDIIEELRKPGRDPREEFKYAKFESGIKEISDLRIGMQLEGVITNVTNFGAFVDIGVHQDGLVHISELAYRFVKHPSEVVSVGKIVKVLVLEVNTNLKRINLSMKQLTKT
ncbi:MAG: Tex family protein [bacterium]